MYIYAVEDKTTRVINIRIPLLEIHINIASLCYMECLPQTVGQRRIQVRVVVNTFDLISPVFTFIGGGRVVRRCWVNFQCRGVLLIWIIVGQGPVALAIGAGGGCLDIFSLICPFSPLSPSLWETARYRLKYCLKGPLNPKQPTNQFTFIIMLESASVFRFIYMYIFLTTAIYL